jgi:GxxExxY protein
MYGKPTFLEIVSEWPTIRPERRRPMQARLNEAAGAADATRGKGCGSHLRPGVLGVKIEDAVMTENAIAKEIVDAAFRIHTTLGPGLLESVYDTVLAYELDRRGLRTVRQQPIPVIYENVRIDTGFRADLIVEDKVIVEVKSVELLAPVHRKQLLTYLRLADKRLGLLINFQVALIKDGIARIVNGLEEDSHAKPQSREDG